MPLEELPGFRLVLGMRRARLPRLPLAGCGRLAPVIVSVRPGREWPGQSLPGVALVTAVERGGAARR
jgi:hypothetical protein